MIKEVVESPASTEDASRSLDNGARFPLPINLTMSKRSMRWRKMLNIDTYKYHSLGDYAATIRRIGTTDSYSTELVSYHALFSWMALEQTPLWQGELEHRNPKSRYSRTSCKCFITQLTQIEHRQAHVHHICRNQETCGKLKREHAAHHPEAHYVMGKSQNHPEIIPLFLNKNSGDPAVKVLVISHSTVHPPTDSNLGRTSFQS